MVLSKRNGWTVRVPGVIRVEMDNACYRTHHFWQDTGQSSKNGSDCGVIVCMVSKNHWHSQQLLVSIHSNSVQHADHKSLGIPLTVAAPGGFLGFQK